MDHQHAPLLLTPARQCPSARPLDPPPPELTKSRNSASHSQQVLPLVSFQGRCASSWAFAAAAALESRLMIGTGTNTTSALSAQHIMVRRLGGWWGDALPAGVSHAATVH